MVTTFTRGWRIPLCRRWRSARFIRRTSDGRPAKNAGAGAAALNGSGATRKTGKKGKRGSYATSANESILTFVKAGDAKGRTTAEINTHFKSEGRSGNAYVALGKLAKAKKLKRKNMPGERGSRFTAG